MHKNIISTAAFLAATVACSSASAAPNESEWEIASGFAVGAAPAYEGSRSYSAIAFPYINPKWRDTVSFGFKGLEAKLYQNNGFEAGVGLSYDSGREEDGDVLFGSGGDDRLLGIGDVDEAAGVHLFATYDMEWATLSAKAIRYLGDDNEGAIVTGGIGKRVFLSKKFFIAPRIEAAWADNSYMDAFYSVTPVQSSRSGLRRFEADAGFKHLSLSITGFYSLSSKWFLMVNAGVKHLLDDTAGSPITEEDTSASVFSVLGYRF